MHTNRFDIMKFLRYLLLLLTGLFPSPPFAQTEVLQIFEDNEYSPVKWGFIEDIHFDSEQSLIIIDSYDGTSRTLKIDSLLAVPSGKTVPLLVINTDEDLIEIPNKTDYKTATIRLEGFGNYDDVETNVNIRGRGNTSWGYDKKPYRLKFDNKISLCGLPKAKSYVLLANWTDRSLMQFAIATKIGQMLELPYTNSVVPVDIILNGLYKGSYMLTNKPGINAGSVNIDEKNSIMWELDAYYDEEFKFRSPIYDLPVMAVDPDLDIYSFEEWKEDFIDMEIAVLSMQAGEVIDVDSYARYILVNEILKNNEIKHPKSLKLYKTKGGKYQFGPIWDFDWCMGYIGSNDTSYNLGYVSGRVDIHPFLKAIEQNPDVKKFLNRYWAQLRTELPEILSYIDDYASKIRTSAYRNQCLWPRYIDFDDYVEKLKAWLTARFQAIDRIDIYSQQ